MELMKLSVLTCDCPTSPILRLKYIWSKKVAKWGRRDFSSRQELCVSFPSTPKTRSSWACCYAVAWDHPRQRQTSNCINPFAGLVQIIHELRSSYQTSQNLSASNEEPRPLPAVRVSKEESVLHVE